MPYLEGESASDYFAGLLQKPCTEDCRLTLATCILRFGGVRHLSLRVERHGEVGSIAVCDQNLHRFSFTPARKWVRAWVRKPEYSIVRWTFDELTSVAPDAKEQYEEVTVRLNTRKEADAFCDLVLQRFQ